MLLQEETQRASETAPPVVDKPVVPEAERALRAELKAAHNREKAANQRALESENTARFWHEKNKETPAPAKTATAEPEDAANFIEQLTERGAGAIDDLLAKRGYVRQDQVEARIARERQSFTTEAALARDYPDLQNSDSEFFKETATQYQMLISETPELKGNPKAMRLAAKLAAVEFELPGAAPKPRKAGRPIEAVMPDDDEEEEEEDTAAVRETTRVRRVQSQSVSTRRSRREAADDEGLDPMQKSMVANLRAAGANITEDKLIARMKAGTNLSGTIGAAAAQLTRRRAS